MGYTPNSLARGLRSNTTKTIAIIFNDIENPVLTYVFREIAIKMAEYGYTTMIFDSQFSEKIERANILTVLSRLPDFIIIEPTSVNNENLVLLSEVSSKLILQGARNESLNCHHVHVDYAYGGYISACEMLSKGHRDCLVMTEELSFPTSEQFLLGIERAFNEYGLKLDRGRVKTGHASIASGFKMIQELWNHQSKKLAIPISCVLTFDDNYAYGVYKFAMQNDLKVPDDISVIGFDDNPISVFSMPPLTTVHLPKEKMAENHLSILHSTLLKERTEICIFSADPVLIQRGSVKTL
nr:LacI family DNA-binding transcriptional regulator [Serratia fonticola]